MSVFALMQGDRLPIIRGELTDASGVVNLASSVAYFVFRSKYNTTGVLTTGVADIISATGGVVEYPWTASDTANSNVFYGRWLVSGNGKFSSFPNDSYITFVVCPTL